MHVCMVCVSECGEGRACVHVCMCAWCGLGIREREYDSEKIIQYIYGYVVCVV